MATDAPLSRWERFRYWLLVKFATLVLRAIFGTCRIEVINRQVEEEYFQGGRTFVGAIWHRNAIFAVWYFGHYHPAIMVSPSRDGEYLARFMRAMGCITVRGSSSRGGREALAALSEHMQKIGGIGTTAADGPRGPAYEAKIGLIVLAMRSGSPLVPVACSADRAWVFSKSWDRTMLPKPFARVKVIFGTPLSFPAEMSEAEMEEARVAFSKEMNRIQAQVDDLCRYGDPVRLR